MDFKDIVGGFFIIIGYVIIYPLMMMRCLYFWTKLYIVPKDEWSDLDDYLNFQESFDFITFKTFKSLF